MSSTTISTDDEYVVLLDDEGHEVGSAAKAEVHHHATPLHLGFSCYLFDDVGRALLTRRALGKQTWPGVWTNSFCGHPGPGESVEDAVRRRAERELGVRNVDPACVLPEFRYRAVAPDATVENEICPVYCARATGDVWPADDEIMDFRWASWQDLRVAAQLPWLISPWAAQQIPLLDGVGLASWTAPREA